MARNKIHNVDTLEKEILRLKLQSRNAGIKLEKQFGKLKDNFGSMLFNSFRRKRDDTDERRGFFDSLFNSDRFSNIMSDLGEKVADKVSGALDKLMERFRKN